ncbi:autotransporter-associated beta strand repeat-containing protein [Luteimonas sp. SX5]|uniref:Autotransporter-associated beta strand repeat-containing protein n=1 Tax=Luteimonas galliterrae TaxID=2940486 RepID=A0ABT0MFI0_9GAMM|nr:autotransporter-associated beta strand repeat-containing protein [Luteimonas galliterrae]MCL1633627.1 autotransporter-associated beta strand repeat-containing protein [Luteimonas galliterrae]
MNRVFRIIWSKTLRAWIVASELAMRCGKGGGEVDKRIAATATALDRIAEGNWRLRLVALGVLIALYVPAQAADRWWDVNATALGQGGTGTWNTSSLFWNEFNDGVTGPMDSWNNAAPGGDNAFFMGTAGTVTLAGPITVHDITFGTNNYTLTGGTLTFTGTTPTINVTTGTSFIDSAIAGTAGITKSGGGGLWLRGANTFSGGFTVSAGGIGLANDASLGAAGNGVSLANGTSITSTDPLAASRTITIQSGVASATNGALTARYTGSGGLNVAGTLSNNGNDYTGRTAFGQGTHGFTSVADLGVASSLGAPTDATSGTIHSSAGGGIGNTLIYSGDGDASNRNWRFNNTSSGGNQLRNSGTGTLTLTGDVDAAGSFSLSMSFAAQTADMQLLGVISSSGGSRAIGFTGGGVSRTITLGGANTYTGASTINGVTVRASTLANTGTSSSFGTGAAGGINLINGVLSYAGAATGTDRTLAISGASAIRNDGTGALSLSGATTVNAGGTLTLDGGFAGTNTLSGVVSGAGNLGMNGAGTWMVSGDNTFTGSTTVQSGTLVAGHAAAFGASGALVVNGGTLDLGGFDITAASLAGTGGNVDTDGGSLTISATSGTTRYGGNITGDGGLTKLGASTLTLYGANTYTGATTVGGGTLALDFADAAAPASNIVSASSTLNLGGGTVNITGANGEANSQSFSGLNVTAGNNTLRATSGTTAGSSLTVNLGNIVHAGGIVNFVAPTSGAFNTSNANGALGGWATITTGTQTDYAEVVGGQIVAFDDYTDQDNASLWQDGQFLSDEGGTANTAFFNTVSGSKQVAGLKYTAAANSTVTVSAGQTLGLDGTIIVSSTTGSTNQTIQGGSVTGAVGGGTLGVLKNSAGTFTIASNIVDNGGAVGFTVGGTGGGTGGALGTGAVALTGSNTYTGATTVSGATLAFNSIGNGGAASAIGASSSASSNLILENGTLRYTGGTAGTDRGFTLINGGTTRNFEVFNAATNVTFSGQVTSPDDAGFTKTGAGTLTLANAGNDYVGVTNIAAGTLAVNTLANGGLASGIGAASSASSNLSLSGGGRLDYLGGTVSTDRGFTLGTGNGRIGVAQAGSTLTMSGIATGTGGLFKDGAGTLVLSGNNTYTGGTQVTAGILQAGSNQAFGGNATGAGAGAMTVNAGTTLDLAGFSPWVGGLNGAGNVLLGSGTLKINGNGSFSGAISGTGGITVSGPTQVMNGCGNSYTGVTALTSATLSTDCLANSGLVSGIGASSDVSGGLVLNSGTLTYTGGTVDINRGFTLLGTGAINVFQSGTTLGFAGPIVGTGGFFKRGAGTLVLSGNNTNSGGISIEAGTLRAGSTSAFGNGLNGVTLSNVAGATLDLDGINNTIATVNGGGAAGGNVTLGSATLTLGHGSAGTATYLGAISGSGSLIKTGNSSFVQVLSGCNSTYDGSTTIVSGVLAVNCLESGGIASSIGDSSADAANLVLNGGTLRYVGVGGSTDRQFTLGTSGGGLEASGTGAIDFTSAAPITLSGTGNRTLTLSGTNTDNNALSARIDNPSSGITSLAKTGTGTWVLRNSGSTYTGATNISGGVLAVDKLANGGQASSIGMSGSAATNLVIGQGSTLRYTGLGDTTDRLFMLQTGVSFIESSGTGAVVFSNTGSASYSGAGARTLALGGTNTGLNTMGGTIIDQNATTGKTTLAKNDAGTWVLTGNNSYSGNTVINDGNLMIGNGGISGNAGTGNVVVVNPTSTLSFNRSNSFNFTGTLSGLGNIAQIGTGTTVLTAANNSIGGVTGIDAGTLQIATNSHLTTGSTAINAGTLQVQTGGSLTTPSIAMNAGSTLNVNGIVQAQGGAASAMTGDAGDSTINVNAGGTLRANGDLGGGSDTVNLAGTLDTGGGVLGLGGGDDTLTINEGATLANASVAAGTGTDTLQVNNTSAMTLGGADYTSFESLIKQNTGPLTLTGGHNYSAGVQLQGGILNAGVGSADSVIASTVTMADNTVLNVNGIVQGASGTSATMTGSAGANTINVAAGGTLVAAGDLGDGSDTVTLSGTLDTGPGTLNLGAGDDAVTLNDGASLAGAGIDAGAHSAGDVLTLNNALALNFDGSRTAGFESLIKQNTGVATMTGSQSFTAGTTISGGTLDVDGSLTTPTVDMTGDTALTVDGSLQGIGGASATISGDGGAQTVTVNGTATATGDLGAGNDTLDVAGTLDLGGGIFNLGDGDDNFVVHDGTQVIGTIDGGAGLDSRTYDINTTADLGALANFEGVTKTGTGTLNINGPGTTDLQDVQVLGGTLNIGAGASVAATAGSALNTVVGSGATLNVDGDFGCGSENDAMSVAGAVTGGGAIDLCGGDDVLIVNDGADFTGFTGTISGGAGIVGDIIVLNNAAALSFGPGNVTGFEFLEKENIGEATLTGSQSYGGGVGLNVGTLTVGAGATLATPTLVAANGTTFNVAGSLQGLAPGSAANVLGDAGVQTIHITGTALATGNLGSGNDTLDVTGTLDTNGGIFNLSDGDDNFVVHDGTQIIGTIDGGGGLDSRTYDINATADLGGLLNFEGVTKTGIGVLNINGPGATDLQDVQVLGGTLNVGAGASVVGKPGLALNTVVGSGATLNVDGSFGCGDASDSLTVAGTVSGSGTIDLCGGDDTLTLSDGTVLANTIDGGAHSTADRVVLNNASAMTFDGTNTINFEILQKDNTGAATLTGAAAYSGGTVLNGGILTVAGSLTTPTVTMADATTLNVDGSLQGAGGAAAITGSAGANTISVAAGATLNATGDLGGGNDVLDAAGTIDTEGGVFSLGAGDDIFNVYDTTDTSLATIDGGLGNDLLDVNVGAGNTVPLGGLTNFESLGKSGAGTLEIHGASSFIDVNLNDGTLRVTGTGSIAANNTTILSGATLELADGGAYGGTAGDDTFTVAGTIVSTGSPNTGRIDLGDGNDTFTIQDGANLSGLAPEPVSGGAGTDTFVADLAGTATLGGAVDFETLTKTNAGTLIVAGPATSSFSTVNVLGGTLDVGAGGSLTGVQNATVASGATLNIAGAFGFTNGADNFTVAGTVTGASAIDMLDGDDTFTIQDGADLSGLAGPVDGGAGNDTFVSDLAGTATLGGAIGFEALNKTNTGTLIVAGPAASSFSTVNVAGGTLDIAAAGSIGGVVTGTVASAATLNVDGSYAGSAGNDSLTIAGSITGNGSIAFGNGDDTLTLNDGADLGAFNGTLDGGAHGAGDRVALNNTGATTFNAANIVNFEFLQKDNTGEATLIGAMSFSSGTTLNGGTLTVGGNLVTPTLSMGDDTVLNVAGILEGGGVDAIITGSAGTNTLTVAGLAAMHGDLGAGDDVLDVSGFMLSGGGVFALGDGDDDFVVHDGTVVTATIDGGAGLDSRVYDINGTAEFGALLNFEGVTKRGAGTLNISGPGATDLQSVEVEGGTLNVGAAGSVVATAGSSLNTVVAGGAILNVEGAFGCGDNADTMTVAGTISGSGTVAMCGGDDTLTLQDGATLANIVDGGADTDTVVLDNANAMSFDGANTVNFETLRKENAGEATLTGASTYTGGTLLNGGTLTVAGELTTPTVALGDATTLNVDGTLQGAGGAATLAGSAGANTVNVTGTLRATGDLGAGNDVFDVAGTLDTGSGTLALGDGDDTLTIHDGTNIVGTVAAGAGNDTFNTDIATNADLGAVQGFETLSKTGAGTLDINGPASSDFTTVNVLAGTLNVASGGSVAAQNSTVAAGATLRIAGIYSGTAGDDSFTSMGAVSGALSFGAGNDTARFVGGDISGLAGVHGGVGGSDLLSFSGLDLDDGNAAGIVEWERVELLQDSSLTLGTSFMPSGSLAIDGTSRLVANAGASIGGSVENAGLIEVGANRFAIGGSYSSNDGALTLTVSPGDATSGGLDIAGDVTGTTRVTFASDGSSPGEGTTSIRVIASPNDNTATAGSFVPDSADGVVRLEGSPLAWEFGQQSDRNWYLSTGEGGTDVLPEIAGYGALPGLGALMSQRGDDLAHQRLAGARGAERPQCGEERNRSENAGTDLIDDCRGVWVAVAATEVELGADPGFEVTGDDTGLYVGVDGVMERENSVLRGGAYLGYMHSVYWATGVNSSAVAGMGPARIDLDTPIVGLYGTSEWDNGNYMDLVLTGQRPRAEVRTADGFADRIDADTLTLSARYGHRYRLDNGWTLEPQVQLSGSRVQWDGKTDAAGRQLSFDDDLVATARAALRVEKAFDTAGGAQIRPWATLAVHSTFGGNDNGLRVAQSGVAPSAFPGHDLGTSANLDAGVEAAVDRNVSFFGAISIGQDLKGSDYEQRGLNLGMRVRW